MHGNLDSHLEMGTGVRVLRLLDQPSVAGSAASAQELKLKRDLGKDKREVLEAR